MGHLTACVQRLNRDSLHRSTEIRISKKASRFMSTAHAPFRGLLNLQMVEILFGFGPASVVNRPVNIVGNISQGRTRCPGANGFIFFTRDLLLSQTQWPKQDVSLLKFMSSAKVAWFM